MPRIKHFLYLRCSGCEAQRAVSGSHGGTSPGNLGYGIATFVYDNAGRVLLKQDQQGDTVTFNYDLAGRMSSRDFRLRVNSPSGTIADSDVFTYDRAGECSPLTRVAMGTR